MVAAEAFFAKVEVAWNGCWLWTGPLNQAGYGDWSAHPEAISRRAHRAAWELLVGPILGDLHIDHLCRVRACVNPDHLEPVTRDENTRRGYGWTAQNGRKTHCVNGHELSPDNVYPPRANKHHGRVCKVCQRARVAANTAKKKLQSSAA